MNLSLYLIKKALKQYQDKNARCRITFKRAGEKKYGHVNLSEKWANQVIKKLYGVPEIEDVYIEKKNDNGEWERE